MHKRYIEKEHLFCIMHNANAVNSFILIMTAFNFLS